MVDEHAPPVGADEPRDRHAPAVRTKLVATLTVAVGIRRPSAIELRPALAETEQRSLAEREHQHRRTGVQTEPLNGVAEWRLHVQRRRVGRKPDNELAGGDGVETVAGAAERFAGRRSHQY